MTTGQAEQLVRERIANPTREFDERFEAEDVTLALCVLVAAIGRSLGEHTSGVGWPD